MSLNRKASVRHKKAWLLADDSLSLISSVFWAGSSRTRYGAIFFGHGLTLSLLVIPSSPWHGTLTSLSLLVPGNPHVGLSTGITIHLYNPRCLAYCRFLQSWSDPDLKCNVLIQQNWKIRRLVCLGIGRSDISNILTSSNLRDFWVICDKLRNCPEACYIMWYLD